MKVNAVDSYRFNNTHFEGKKNKEIQKPIHSANPIKAIPVAVLIAMSPLNAPLANAQTGTLSTVETKAPLILIGTYTYEHATPNNETCNIEYWGKDANSDTFDKLRLKFITKRSNHVADLQKNTSRRFNYEHYTNINLQELETKTTKYIDSNGVQQTKIKYYAVGYGSISDSQGVYEDSKEPVKRDTKTTTYPRLSKSITEELYNDLKELMGDDIKYTNTFE